MRAWSLTLLLLAGCGADPVGEGTATANQIERLSTPEQEPAADPLASARLQPLDPGDITHEGLSGPGCRFSIGGAIVLAADAGDAVARIGGETLHFTHSAPVGPSGGFFEDRQVSISVGRTDAAETPARDMIGWPARITVTNRRTGAQLEQDGSWRCGV
jgi:hypothetical protein